MLCRAELYFFRRSQGLGPGICDEGERDIAPIVNLMQGQIQVSFVSRLHPTTRIVYQSFTGQSSNPSSYRQILTPQPTQNQQCFHFQTSRSCTICGFSTTKQGILQRCLGRNIKGWHRQTSAEEVDLEFLKERSRSSLVAPEVIQLVHISMTHQ